jgi:radical SAM superfamily enzyme YgiQ (UPF0313 family)
MKVLVVAVNRSRSPVAVMPYGACAAAQAAQDAGHDVRLLDLMFERSPARALQRACREFRPGVVGFSLRNIDNNDMSAPVCYAGEAEALASAARAACAAKIVLGGAAVAVMPEALLRRTGADCCVVGDGSAAFPRLLAALAAGASPLGVPGVAMLKEGRYTAVPQEFSAPDGLYPDLTRWLDLRAYARRMSPAPLKTKLGCPFDCVYCTYPVGEGQAYRLVPPAEAAAAALALARAGVRDIEFVDNVFNSPYDHAMRLCAELAAARSGARFHTMELNPGFTDGPLLEAMERAGFAGIGVTAESADDGVLAALGKGYGAARLELAAEAVGRSALPCMWIFLLGGPGETEASVMRTLDFARRRVRRGDAAFFNAGLRVYPGTRLETIARAEGVISVPPEDMLEPVFYLSPGVRKDWLLETLAAATRENMNFLSSGTLALPVLPWLYTLAGLAGFKPPLWRHTAALRRGLRTIGVKA